MTVRGLGRRHGDDGRRLVYLSWGAVAGRSEEIAAALGGTSVCFFPPSARRRPATPLRYLLSAVGTITVLARRRPAAVIVTNPPVFPALIVALWARAGRAPFVLDDHPGSFGAQGYRLGAWLGFVHRWIVPQASACLVTGDSWAAVVESWGGRPLVVHEAPGTWEMAPRRAPSVPVSVLFVGTFASDEPVDEIVAAAAGLDVHLVVTGDLRRRPPGPAAPPNVEYCGLLPFDEYRQLVYDCDIVVALSTEPTSAMRAAFEAVWSGRPLVVSDWPLLRELFPDAVHTGNDAASLRTALERAVADLAALDDAAPGARRRQMERWEHQLHRLRSATTAARRGQGTTGRSVSRWTGRGAAGGRRDGPTATPPRSAGGRSGR